jgi:hypothetical protein
MNIPLAALAAVSAAGLLSPATSALDLHVTTGDNGLQAQMTADVRDGLHSIVTANDTGLFGTARITLGPSVITVDKPAGQPLHIGVAGLGVAPSPARQAHAVHHNLTASTAGVAATPSLTILGDLGSAGSVIADEVVRWTRATIPFLLLGLLLMSLLPMLPGAVRATAVQPPWTRLGIGLVALVAMPSAALGLLVAGIFLGVWWLGFLMLGLYALALAVGYTFAGMILGRAVLDRLGGSRVHLFWSLLGGLALLSLLSLAPYVGAAVAIVALTYGVGALALAPRTQVPAEGASVGIKQLRLPAIRLRRRRMVSPAPVEAPALKPQDQEAVGPPGSSRG